MRDGVRAAPEWWGAQGLCMRNTTQGRAHTQWGRGAEGKRRPLHPRVVRSPIEAHGVGQKGEGRLPHAERLCGTPARKRRWGACDAAPILMAPPILPCLRTSPSPCPNVGAAFSAPQSRGREGEGQCAHKTGAPFPWGPCFVRALIASEGGGH